MDIRVKAAAIVAGITVGTLVVEHLVRQERYKEMSDRG